MKDINLNELWAKISKKKQKYILEDKPVSLNYIWKITIIIFAVVNLFIITFAWYIYLGDQIGGGYVSQPTIIDNTYTRVINKKNLDADLSTMNFKQNDFGQLKLNRAKTIDPSL